MVSISLYCYCVFHSSIFFKCSSSQWIIIWGPSSNLVNLLSERMHANYKIVFSLGSRPDISISTQKRLGSNRNIYNQSYYYIQHKSYLILTPYFPQIAIFCDLFFNKLKLTLHVLLAFYLIICKCWFIFIWFGCKNCYVFFSLFIILWVCSYWESWSNYFFTSDRYLLILSLL